MAKRPTLISASSLEPEQKSELFNDVTRWNNAKKALDAAKSEEESIRRELAEKYATGAPKGVNKIALGIMNGKKFELQIDVKISTSLDKKALAEKIRNDELTVADISKYVKYSPNLIDSAWHDEDNLEDRRIIEDLVTEKPGMPGMKLHSVDVE